VANWTAARVWANMWDHIAQMGVAMAKVQTVDKTKIVTMIVSMDKTKGVDTIALAWYWSS